MKATSPRIPRNPVTPTGAPVTLKNRTFWACLLLAAVTFIVYWPVTAYEYVGLDDDLFVTLNPHVLGGLTWENVRWSFQFGHGDYWHPLTWLSLMLDVSLFGSRAGGLHAVNLILHAANAVLLFLILARWTGAFWQSAAVAAFFALHPLRVESVAWVTERKDVLSGLFWMLTLWAYGEYARGREKKGEGRGANWEIRNSKLAYALALFFFVLGLMSKAMIVTLPFVLLLLDYWPLNRVPGARVQASALGERGTSLSPPTSHLSPFLRLFIEKIPFFILGLISSALTFSQQQRIEVARSLSDLPWSIRLETVFVAYASYLEKTFWPTGLAPHYPHPFHWSPADVARSVALVAVLCFAALRFRRKYPYVFVGWFWFFGMLVPVIGLTKGWLQYLADRFTYLPSIGFFILIFWSVGDFLTRRPRPGMNRLVAAVFALLLVVAAVRTQNQLSHWRNSEALFRHTISVTKNSDLAYYNLGCALNAQGRTVEAIDCFREAIRINPNYTEAHNNLGGILIQGGKVEEGAKHCGRALELRPNCAEAHNNLGLACANEGKTAEAIAHYREATRLAPDYAEPHSNLGNEFFRGGKLDEAAAEYRKAIQLDPRLASAPHNLAIALASAGKIDEAIAQYQVALRLAPSRAETYNNLGSALGQKGLLDEAIQSYRRAVTLNPAYTDAWLNLGHALNAKGFLDEAIDAFRKAVAADPGSIDARNNLAAALAARGKLDESSRQSTEALRLAPNSAAAHCEAANVLFQKGQIKEAIEHYREAIRLKPDYAEAHDSLGVALALNGNLKDAIAQFNEAVRINPNFAGAYFNLGNALSQDDQHLDEAIASFRRAILVNPGHFEALNSLGALLASRQDFDEAIGLFRRALLISPLDASAHRNLANALEEKGLLEQSVEHYERVAQIEATDPEAHFHWGRVLARLGRNDQAKVQFTEALRLKPDYAEAREQLRALDAHK